MAELKATEVISMLIAELQKILELAEKRDARLPAPLVTPAPNLNGNSPESLIGQLMDVRASLSDVVDACRAASDCWHGRNFQSFGPEKGQALQMEAMEAWHQRIAWLTEFEQEVTNLAVEIQRKE